MKYIAEFFNFSKKVNYMITGEGEGEYPEHLKQLDRQNGDTYCTYTRTG
jgi:hypothetical protein